MRGSGWGVGTGWRRDDDDAGYSGHGMGDAMRELAASGHGGSAVRA
jgi:hypothetical protein